MGWRLATWPAHHMTENKGARTILGGLSPNIIQKWVFLYSLDFYLILSLLLMDFLHFWEILGIFGAQILGGSWGWITNFRSIKTRPV
jgi:hypothetical protein